MAVLLVVDDDARVRHFLVEAVRLLGHTVHQANHAGEAMAILRQSRIDLVLTDLYMPERDGLELLIALKRDFPGTRVIALTGGLAGEALLKAAQMMGADATLSKPVTVTDLQAAVDRVLALPPPDL